jgi:hypothetical protein
VASLPVFLENEQTPWLSLNGDWRFSLAGGAHQALPVPSAWDARVRHKDVDGPAIYRCSFQVPASRVGRGRLLLEFGAVSFWALVRVNSVQVDVHQGMWSPFQVDISRWAHAGENSLELEVWKPGKRFPPREVLAGFLPDVATPYGGIWQGVRLLALDAGLGDLRVLAKPDRRLEVTGLLVGVDLNQPPDVVVEVDPGTPAAPAVRVHAEAQTGRFKALLDLRGMAAWKPGAPVLHKVAVSAWAGDVCQARASRQVGLRDITTRTGDARIDGRPLHLRGVLDWGWHPQELRPAPSRQVVTQQIEQARALGFNLIKLCLFVPDETTFQVADESGQYLWLEMPLWQPHLTPAARELALQEFQAIFRRVHHHPSIVVVSLGCELNAEADSGFLAELHKLAREWFPNALICDNSGSAEAYGGVTTELQDFYDYHFYADPHYFQPLVDHFDRGYRPPKPWIFGEFCDADTGRDFSALRPEVWWLSDPVTLDRDDFLATRDYQARLAVAGLRDGGAELARAGRQQATAIRKYILEQTRQRSATGGYVVSGWSDTPITTSGIVDDRGQPKFAGEEWLRFNNDSVLAIDRGRHRAWVNGGDRPAQRDPFTWWAGERAELHLLLANTSGEVTSGQLFWRLVDASGKDLATDIKMLGSLPDGQVIELAPLRWTVPAASQAPAELSLQVGLTLNSASGRQSIQNRWTLWAVPRPNLGPSAGVIGLERLTARYDLTALSPETHWAESRNTPDTAPVLANELSAMLIEAVRSGRDGVLWQTQPDPRYTRPMPFWREAIHSFSPHPLWTAVPQPGYADMRFFSVASDMALDLPAVQAIFGPTAQYQPVWRRFDARSLRWADYIIEVRYGAGRLFVSSLRFHGGHGRQPEGFAANPWGAWLLASLLQAPH